MAKYRKKPVVVEAWHLPEHWPDPTAEMCLHWMVDAYGETITDDPDHPQGMLIHTMEGIMLADPGDWIIRGVEGELYPCKNLVFLATYELVEELT